MSIPFYVNPETAVREKADFARKNIARGRPVVALEVSAGVVLVTENRSARLRKTAELYDRVAFAGVGRLNEFESLRVAGVRMADLKGFAYHREDVTARYVANAYAQGLAMAFSNELKPYEVELMVVQVGELATEPVEMYHIRYDGYLSDEHGFMVMGGEADELRDRLAERYTDVVSLSLGVKLAVEVLSPADAPLGAEELEVSLLQNSGPRRRFRRLRGEELSTLLE